MVPEVEEELTLLKCLGHDLAVVVRLALVLTTLRNRTY